MIHIFSEPGAALGCIVNVFFILFYRGSPPPSDSLLMSNADATRTNFETCKKSFVADETLETRRI